MQIKESYVPCKRSKIVTGSRMIFIFFTLYQKLQIPSSFTISRRLDVDTELAFYCGNNFDNINMSKPMRI